MRAKMIFKCRRCSANIEVDSRELHDSGEKLGHKAYSILVNWEKDPYSKYSTHRCLIGGNGFVFGLCDLVGIQFEEGADARA